MQRGRGGGDDLFDFGDPFAGFGGYGGHRNLIPSLFGGRDPFDDPFFNRPSGGMFGPSMFGPSMFGPSMFGPSMFGPRGSFFGDAPASGFVEHEPPQANKSEGLVIKELNSDDEEVGAEDEKLKAFKEKNDNPRKHSRSSKEPYVEDPDDEAEGRRSKQMQYKNDYNRADRAQPQARSFSFQSSSVTYGGVDGAYYTSSTARRTGSDGVMIEESKEADTTTGRATHRMSRGLQDKGHSVTRKLDSDGKVDTMQTLHNLNEDELPGFEESWQGNARKHLPGWSEGFNRQANTGTSSTGPNGQATNGGWALPSTGQQQPRGSERMGFDDGFRPSASKGRAKSSIRINID
ncbi:myeloid leukemia factor 1-like [Macadamia integrifolia]|uniref:myeloid leukemia factor 1-like n=1 Tax=Macadamia integrifolia TaxID=60698 RepID=UPI001C52BB6D|nr:myeloid leukemia factor 1-like [Macadamia integrifolia]XP_042481417.1 myeloid leukemia factor 1-like [Macadamia integrifolia]